MHFSWPLACCFTRHGGAHKQPLLDFGMLGLYLYAYITLSLNAIYSFAGAGHFYLILLLSATIILYFLDALRAILRTKMPRHAKHFTHATPPRRAHLPRRECQHYSMPPR